MILLKKETSIDRTDFFYPSSCQIYSKKTDLSKAFPTSTLYGICLGSTEVVINDSKLELQNEAYFSLATRDVKKLILNPKGSVVLFIRHGYSGLNQIGLNCEQQGRLSYIDGCTDSTLIFPARYGDPSLNLLCFPSNTEQTMHRHPTLRFGVILEGAGFADAGTKSHPLRAKDVFMVPENEAHRFRTDDKEMRLIAFHPDSDFGPRDNDHAMLNRTYITS